MKVLSDRDFAFSRFCSYEVWKTVPITTVPAAELILAFSLASLQNIWQLWIDLCRLYSRRLYPTPNIIGWSKWQQAKNPLKAIPHGGSNLDSIKFESCMAEISTHICSMVLWGNCDWKEQVGKDRMKGDSKEKGIERGICRNPQLKVRKSHLIKFTIHRSAASSGIPKLLASIFKLMHWWIRQYCSKMNHLAFSTNSCFMAVRK